MVKDKITRIGTVIEAFPNATFRVKFNDDDKEAFCYLAGRLRLYFIKILVGDKVKVEFNPNDETKGRIVQRL